MLVTVPDGAASGLLFKDPGKGTEVGITHGLSNHFHGVIRIDEKILCPGNAVLCDVVAHCHAGDFLKDIIKLGFAD